MFTKNTQSLGGKKTAVISRKKAIERYYEKPNICQNCLEIIHPKEKQKISEVRKKKFCDHSCCASYQNKNKQKSTEFKVKIKKESLNDKFGYRGLKRAKSNRILNGYLVIYMPEHPKSMKTENWDGYIYEHIPIAEKDLGRYLRDDEEVHHLDFNKMNNSPDNLLVMIYQSHGKLHFWLKENNIKPKQKELKRCVMCGYPLRQAEQKKYCSAKCYSNSIKSNLEISVEQLISDFKELKSFLKVGNKYGISDNGLRKWMKVRLNMSTEDVNNFKKKHNII